MNQNQGQQNQVPNRRGQPGQKGGPKQSLQAAILNKRRAIPEGQGQRKA
jgi:hypothetical protein